MSHLTKIYREHIEPLSLRERPELMDMVLQDLLTGALPGEEKRNLMDLHGLGKEIWNRRRCDIPQLPENPA